MSQLNYKYASKTGIRLDDKILYPDEKVKILKEKIEFEDTLKHNNKNTNVYLTNFRILILTNENIFDIPYFFMNKIKLSKPLIGSPRIKLYIQKDPILLKIICPYYLKNFFSGKEVYNCSILYPEKITLYFPKEEIDKLFDSILKIHEEQEYSNAPKITLKPSHVPKLEENIENKNYVRYGAGLQGIVEKNKENDKRVKAQLNQAFLTLDDLKANILELTSLGERLRNKLNNQSEDEKQINDILRKVGYVDPVTKETAGSEYYDKLAQQINEHFNDYFTKNPNTKVLTLIDAYCNYNIARKSNVISPKDMKLAVNKLKFLHNKKVFLKSLNNEMLVLHSSEYTNDNILKTFENYLKEKNKNYLSESDIKKILGIDNTLLFKYLIDDLLINGKICADENGIEINYYMNIINSYNFNYQY